MVVVASSSSSFPHSPLPPQPTDTLSGWEITGVNPRKLCKMHTRRHLIKVVARLLLVFTVFPPTRGSAGGCGDADDDDVRTYYY